MGYGIGSLDLQALLSFSLECALPGTLQGAISPQSPLIRFLPSQSLIYSQQVLSQTPQVCPRLELRGGSTTMFASALFYLAPTHMCVFTHNS